MKTSLSLALASSVFVTLEVWAGPLPFEDGTYVDSLSICGSDYTGKFGDQTGWHVRTIEGAKFSDGYDLQCEIKNAKTKGDTVSATAACDVEGEQDIRRLKFKVISKSSFMDGKKRFTRCP